MTPATYRRLVPSLLLLFAVAVPARALDEPRSVDVPLDTVHVMLGTPGDIASGWVARAVVGDAAAGIPLQLVDLAAVQRTTLAAEGSWRPWWAAPIAGGWLELDIEPDAWSAGTLPTWSGALHWRLAEHTQDGQQLVAQGVNQPALGTDTQAGAAPLVATDGSRVATWEQTLDGGAPAWHIVVRSLDDDAIVSDRAVGPIAGLAVDERGVAWTDATVIDGISQPRLSWAATDGDAIGIEATDGAVPASSISDISLADGQLVWLSAGASWTASVSADGVAGATTRLSRDDAVSVDAAIVDGAFAWIESDRLLVGVADAAPVQLRLPPQAIDGPPVGRRLRLDSLAAGDGWLTVALRPAAGEPQRLLAFPWAAALR